MTDTPLTQRQKDGLRARGFTDEAMLDIPPEEADQIIRDITPERAQEILNDGVTAPEPDHAPPANEPQPTDPPWDASFAPEDAPPTSEPSEVEPERASPPTGPDRFDWVAHTEAVVADIFDEPNAEMSRPPEDVRYGNHGSVSINFTTGIWYDHENERGGGIKELIRVYKEIDDRDAAIAYAEQCQQNFENGAKPLSKGNSKGRQNSQLKLEAIYSYLDASGSIAFEVLRYLLLDPVSKNYIVDARGKRIKTFRQRRPSGEPDGSLLWGLDAGEYMRQAPGKNWLHFNAAKFEQYPAARQRKAFPNAAPVIPYRLPELLKATAAGQTICIAEGEKKVDLIRSFGFPATCCAEGAKKMASRAQCILQRYRRRIVTGQRHGGTGSRKSDCRKSASFRRQANTHS